MKKQRRQSAPLVLEDLRRNKLAHVISVGLATLFSIRIAEAEAMDTLLTTEPEELNRPSAASLDLDSQPDAGQMPPSYLDVAMQAAHEAPQVFMARTLLGAPAPITLTTAGAVGITSSGSHSDQAIKLGAAATTGIEAGAGEDIRFATGRVESSALNATQARNQIGVHATDGGHVGIAGSSVVLEPKTGAGAVITASDMTGVIVDAGGSVTLTDTSVLIGGGAKGNNNRGVVITGPGSSADISGGAISTSSWGAVGVKVEDGASARLADGVNVTTSGARSTATGGSHGVQVTGEGSRLIASDATVTTSGGSAYGMRVEDGASVEISGTDLNTSGGNGHGILVDSSSVGIDGGRIGTSGKGSVGVWARNGATVVLSSGTEVVTSGAGVSAAAPVDGEKALSLSHGLLASGANTRIEGNGIAMSIGGSSASAARAEDDGRIILSNSAVEVVSGATTTATTAALHALSGGQVFGSNLDLSTLGVNVGGARAEGAGSSVVLDASTLTIAGSGSIANPAAAARAMDGGSIVVENSTLSTQGTFGHGVSGEGVGSHVRVANSNLTTEGARSMGVYLKAGATGEVDDSRILVTAPLGAVGPWAPGVLVEGAGSSLALSRSDVHTTQGSSTGVRAQDGATLSIDKGSVTTDGNYSTAIAGSQSTISVNNVTVTTHGNDNAMGVLADVGAIVTVSDSSITSTGNGSPVASNLTFPHGLASRNPGALLSATRTSVVTQGSQAYGAAVDDGGSMLLDDVSVRTEGTYSVGLYAGIGSIKPGQVSLDANNVTVKTLGDHAAGALVSRRYQDETATLNLTNASVHTEGLQSHGLRAESGAALSADNSVVTSSGIGALGAIANNGSTVELDRVGITTTGNAGHGAVAKNGGSVNGTDVLITVTGDHASALYAQGTEAQKGEFDLSNAVLNNRDGAGIAVAGVADIALESSIVGGSGQWLNVDSSVASDGTSLPDMGTGQWQGIGQSFDATGRATLDLSGSIVTGSAATAAGSHSSVTLREASIWHLTGDSNLSALNTDTSLIDFSAPIGGLYKKLTVNDYQGNNATLALNTYLYDDDSPSDQLVIDGGKASGSSNLWIRNAGGPGALTQGNGIKVVDAINQATTDADAFRLLHRVKAGPYEYTLYRSSLDDSNANAWYLRSTKDAVPVDPVDPVDP
ncbi:autotransporter outer membrane beta-barrel domain-containing protein, partial [Pseudomonas sp. JG-B]